LRFRAFWYFRLNSKFGSLVGSEVDRTSSWKRAGEDFKEEIFLWIRVDIS